MGLHTVLLHSTGPGVPVDGCRAAIFRTITGTVSDPSGAAVAGAAVTVTNTGTGATYNATSSAQGVFTFAQLPVGSYDLKVTQSSFKDYLAKGVEVHTSTTTDISPKLEVGAHSDTVTVEASSVQVDTTQAAVGEVIESTQVRKYAAER